MLEHRDGADNDRPFVSPRSTDDRGQPLPRPDDRAARVATWDEAVRKMAAIVHPSDDDEAAWDEAMRNLGVDPVTGQCLAP